MYSASHALSLPCTRAICYMLENASSVVCSYYLLPLFFLGGGKLKKHLLEEKEESLSLLRSKLEEKYSDSMRAAKQQWLKEKGEQVEKEVALAKAHWEKEEKKVWSFYLGISNESNFLRRRTCKSSVHTYSLCFCHLRWVLRVCCFRRF